ncbi:hypothetical protein [Polaromonas sp. CG_9.11]|uniref:hypothetical protein n=1 Tax=Polaromonas sp. CG_9.11 TaxID=2787730 RepID=UPI001E2CE1D8|nr:hypothetical protein [Polaromonas sp. CG_9.11]
MTEPTAGLPRGIKPRSATAKPHRLAFVVPMPGRHHGSKLLENASKGQNYLQFDRLELSLWQPQVDSFIKLTAPVRVDLWVFLRLPG